MIHSDGSRPVYTRDPVLLWGALVSLFAILVMILGLTLGHVIATRRAAMLAFVNSYQIVAEQQAQRPVQIERTQ
jgi:hypothetical protein